MKKQDLEERLINFAVLIVGIVESMPEQKQRVTWERSYYVRELHLP